MKSKRNRKGHVSYWHPWLDKAGRTHDLAVWEHGKIVNLDTGQLYPINSAVELHDVVSKERLHVYCEDPASFDEFPFLDDLLRISEPILSQNKVIGYSMKVPFTPYSGAIIPYSNFVQDLIDIDVVRDYFDLMGYQGVSVGSVSEKLFRATLPKRHGISRPNSLLRQKLVNYAYGGRLVLGGNEKREYETVYEYDFNNAYLNRARVIPDPRRAPFKISKLDDPSKYAAAFVQATLRPAQCAIGPLPMRSEKGHQTFINRNSKLPITGWWWWDEIQDAIEAGFQLVMVGGGWAWPETSECMNQWADLLLEKKIQAAGNKSLERLVKLSMVALPGRFQMRPEKYSLETIANIKASGIEDKVLPDFQPLLLKKWTGGNIISDFVVKTNRFSEHAALVPQGSYIVMQQRRALRQLMEGIQRLDGYRILFANTDNVYINKPLPEEMRYLLGPQDGQLKEKTHTNVIIQRNRVISDQDCKIPGVSNSLEREKIMENLRSYT